MQRRCWNGDIEPLPPASLRQLVNARLQAQLEYVWASSPFYQAKFSSAGVKRNAMRDLADLPLLPFTEKDEIRQNQQEHPPFGSYLATTPERWLRVPQTSATTARALSVALPDKDRHVMNESAARSFRAAGLHPTHTVV